MNIASINSYVALLRGINVGGNCIIKMSEIRNALSNSGFNEVKTYIQSGNIIFKSIETDTVKLANSINKVISDTFKIDAGVIVFSKDEWIDIINNAPAWWGDNSSWKHNLLILLKPYDMGETIKAIGELKPDIEAIQAGEGVIYQSMSLELFGRTTNGKLASNPVYKKMTVRNFNTANKLANILIAY